MLRLMPRQGQIEGKRKRRIDRQQLAIAAEIQRRQPGGFSARCLPVMTVWRRGRLMAGMLMVLAKRRGSGLRRL